MIQRPIAKSLLETRLCQAATAMQKLIGTVLSLIEVKLADKSKVRGRLDRLDTNGFIVTTPAADQASDEPGAGGQIARDARRSVDGRYCGGGNSCCRAIAGALTK